MAKYKNIILIIFIYFFFKCMKNLGSQQEEVICMSLLEPGIAFQILSGESEPH